MTPEPLRITCKEFVELVTAHLDGALPAEDRRRFDCHSVRCPGCRAYLQQFHLTVDALSHMREGPTEPDNIAELIQALKDSERRADSWSRDRGEPLG
jgi:anti-sigma factor RsiW